MTGIRYPAFLWTVVITLTGFVCRAQPSLLERLEGEAATLRCSMEPAGKQPPVGLYLRRSFLRSDEVFFKYTKNDATINGSFKERLRVIGDPSDYAVNVTISPLMRSDTDRYSCEFLVERVGSEDEKIPGNTDVFLHVSSGNECGCSSYPTLLYALLSGAVGILLLILILVGCVAVCRGKTHQSPTSQSQAPIYEEMIGVQPLSRKLASHRLEEVESSEYKNCLAKKSISGNHYESPSGALFPRRNDMSDQYVPTF